MPSLMLLKVLRAQLLVHVVNQMLPLLFYSILFLSHADRGRAQDDVGLMGETDLRSSEEKGTVN